MSVARTQASLKRPLEEPLDEAATKKPACQPPEAARSKLFACLEPRRSSPQPVPSRVGQYVLLERYEGQELYRAEHSQSRKQFTCQVAEKRPSRSARLPAAAMTETRLTAACATFTGSFLA